MSIMKNLQKMHVAVVNDTFNGSPKKVGQSLSEHAVAAIMKGFGSPEWEKYMKLFADNAEQLKRLTKEGPDDLSYYPTSRAYIVANAVCGAGTTGQTHQDVRASFGDAPAGMASFDDEDAEFIASRPFEVPEPNG